MRIRMVAGNAHKSGICQNLCKTISEAVSMHWHDVYELDIILEGTGETVCNNRRKPLRRGLMSLLSPKDYHEYRNCEGVRLISIQFREDGIGSELLHRFLAQPTRTVYADEAAMEKLLKLHALMEGGDAWNQKLLECMILLFLDRCNEAEGAGSEPTPIQNAVMYVNSHFRENPKMADVAARFYLSESYFCRLFKKTTQKSYKAYLKELKLDYGMLLLGCTNLSVSDIAARCGYATLGHFTREFRLRYGNPPTYYRKES